ncbi:hypothetical protein ACFQZ2_00230 [Streptomonospora algeriensis]|uniref:Uncharacterized protein n=1 Tax=Streptomonospora algeriensis TaxID=995084 RepID=A0ABW3BBA7_9ACTN
METAQEKDRARFGHLFLRVRPGDLDDIGAEVGGQGSGVGEEIGMMRISELISS